MTATILLGYNMKIFIHWDAGQKFVRRIFPSGSRKNVFEQSRAPHYLPYRENSLYLNLVLQLRVSIFKINNLLKEKADSKPIQMMEFW